MNKPLTVGILREYKGERRCALSPQDVKWLVKRGVKVEVLSCSKRIFSDKAFERAGAKIVRQIKEAKLLVGVKEPAVSAIREDSIYCAFSHTIKGQPENRNLLKQVLEKHSTLLDYECIKDRNGVRLVYFGRFAGICGAVDALHLLGKRLEILGQKTLLLKIKRAYEYAKVSKIKDELGKIRRLMRHTPMNQEFFPFIIGITGHGRVSQGASEVLSWLGVKDIHPRDIHRVHTDRHQFWRIYKTVFDREEKFRSKSGESFYFEQYLENPKNYESNLDKYLDCLTLLIHGSYWDDRFPRLVTTKMIEMLEENPNNHLKLIADISCDVDGSIEITKKTTSILQPTFLYDPAAHTIRGGLKGKGMAVMAIDNLPTELPEDSSLGFSEMIRDYIYQISKRGVTDLDRSHTLPIEIRNAVIARGGKLTKRYVHLKKLYKL